MILEKCNILSIKSCLRANELLRTGELQKSIRWYDIALELAEKSDDDHVKILKANREKAIKLQSDRHDCLLLGGKRITTGAKGTKIGNKKYLHAFVEYGDR